MISSATSLRWKEEIQLHMEEQQSAHKKSLTEHK